MSDAAKMERNEICLEKDSVESNMITEILNRQAGLYGFGEREGEREREGLTILEICYGRPIRRNSILEGLRVQ